jgi:hypothetical protein
MRLEIRMSRWFGLLLILVTGGFVGAGILMFAMNGVPTLFGCAYIGFGAILLIISFWMMLDNRPRVVIDDAGIDDRVMGIGVIRWADVSEAFLLYDHQTTYMCLELRNPEQYLERMSSSQRAMSSWDRLLGYTEFSINITGLDRRADDILNRVRNRINATDLAERP